jgi:hypothetical protein
MRNLRLLLAAFAICLADPAYSRTVSCADGTTANARRGACSHHGGIAKTPAEKAPAEKEGAASPTGGTAQCRDGTYIHTAHRQGACSHDGGVVHWMKTTRRD